MHCTFWKYQRRDDSFPTSDRAPVVSGKGFGRSMVSGESALWNPSRIASEKPVPILHIVSYVWLFVLYAAKRNAP